MTSDTPQGHFVQANGLKIYYEEQGQGRPLVLLHGGILKGDSWKPYLPTFARHYRVIMPDTRGHGHTDNPTGEMSFRLLAEDVVALVRTLRLEKPVICGYSDGGQVALEIGMRYPDLAQALIIGCAYPELTDGSRVWVKSVLGDETSPEVDFDKFERDDPGFATFLQETHGENWKTLLRNIKPMWNAVLNYTPQDFARVTAPTLVLLGDRDGFVSLEEGLRMYRLLPNAEFAAIPQAEHPDFISSPQKVALAQSLIMDFLTRHGGTANDATDPDREP
jgi:pimeloyl-ACP methyl ester carboxylesterase